ncbi:MAG: CoA transferase [Acidimicrobiia bacterium]|nr:CoA transferase [Acidimicrobiia bacterium]
MTSDDRIGPPPLTSIRVLDIGTLLAGPVAATFLGDFGAEVIKVEQPGRGDTLRGSPRDGKPGRSTSWMVEGRNKKSITVNLRVPEGQELLRELIGHADVLVENFTPGTLEAWSLGWNDVHELNPRLIMTRVSGWGQVGPYAQRPGYDRIALGFSGYMYPTGFPDRIPVRPAFPTADYNSAAFAAMATVLALYERDANGGSGQMIDLALYEPTFRITGDLVAGYARHGRIRERIGNRNATFTPAGTFSTKDDRFVQIAAGGDNVWPRLARAMGREDLATDERYARGRDRNDRADELEGLVAEWVGRHDYAEVEAILVEADVPVGGIYTPDQIVDDPHYAARDNIVTVDDEALGPFPMPNVIPKLSATPGRVAFAGVELGHHNDEILGGLLGRTSEELAALRADGVI